MIAIQTKSPDIQAEIDGDNLSFSLRGSTISLGAWLDLSLSIENVRGNSISAFVVSGKDLLDRYFFVFYRTKTNLFQARIFLEGTPSKITIIQSSSDAGEVSLQFRECSKSNLYAHLVARSLKAFLSNPIKNTPRLFRNAKHFISHDSFSQIRPPGISDINSYRDWIVKYDFQAEEKLEVKNFVASLTVAPKISVLIPVMNPKGVWLHETIDSLKSQIYRNWEGCICINGEVDQTIMDYLEDLKSSDERFKIARVERTSGPSEVKNKALSLASGGWVTCIGQDDLLRPHSFAECIRVITSNDRPKLIYADEDRIDCKGQRSKPHFKPSFSDELILSSNYMNHLTMFNSNEIRSLNGWKDEADGAEDYDLILRVIPKISKQAILHIPKILYHRRIETVSISDADLTRNVRSLVSKKGVKNYLNNLSISAKVETCEHSGFNRIRLALSNAPKISIIIPTRNQRAVLETCVNSIFEKTKYSNFEVIIIDNGSTDIETKEYLSSINQRKNLSVLRYDKPFNYSEINNFAVEHAKGEVICLLNNDTKVITEDWLSEMVSWLQIDGVGCVGAKLLFPNNLVQHGGVILGIGGVAGHAHKYFPSQDLGYFGRLAVVQNFSAVTAACMMLRKSDFLSVGGLNADDLAVSYNDVDLCLKLSEKGLRTVWTPHAELIHYESMSRGKVMSAEKRNQWLAEARYMREKWGEILENDPYYSLNLSRLKEDFSYKL